MTRTIASIKRDLRLAAAQLRDENQQINTTALARKIQMPRRTLGDILTLTIPELNDELVIVTSLGSDWNRSQVFSLLEATAEVITREGQKPSCENMATKLNWRYKRLQRYVREHPELREKLDLHTDMEARIWQAGRKLRFQCERVTIAAIALLCDSTYLSVVRVLVKKKEWRVSLALQRAKRGSGATLFAKTPKYCKGPCKNSLLSPKPRLPLWCENRRHLPKPHTLEVLKPLDRVIVVLELRYRLEKGSLVHPSAQDWRFTRIRYLAMYLMSRDLLMNFSQIATIMNLSAERPVKKGIGFIESELTPLEPELKRLRKFY
jgi:hypothetical protein